MSAVAPMTASNPAATGLHVDVRGDGPPLVLLHGWAMHGGLFAPLVPAFAARYRVHVVDLPGHGFSATVAPYSLDRLTDALAAALPAQPATFLGWSLGAIVALQFALRFPQRVSALQLVAATPRFTSAADWPHAMAPQTLARFGDELAAAYRLTLQRFLALQVQGSADGRVALSTMREALFARGEPPPAVLAAGLELLAQTDLRAAVRSIAAPTLLISGARDALTPPAAGAWLARAMPAARHIEIAGAAHAPFLSHRTEFESTLRAFDAERHG